jgi:hypothetical protein
MFDQPYVKLVDLLRMLEAGELDVVQFGRAFQRNAQWAAEIYGSLCREPQRPINGFVWWLPPTSERPAAGRYQEVSPARLFIVDGQQRSTALAGGAGIRPACYPPDVWDELGGPGLEVGIVLESTRRLHVQPMRPRRHPQIRLGALLRADLADIPVLIAQAAPNARPHEAGQFAARLSDMRNRLLETTIPVSWLRGGVRDAAESYRVLNQRASATVAHESEIETLYLDVVAPGVRRDVLDPLQRYARQMGFAKVVTAPLVNELVQRQLPPAARRSLAVKAAEPIQIQRAAQCASDACAGVIDYLRHRGLADESLVYMPAAIGVLMHLAAHFPKALRDEFGRRWLVHALAGERYRARPYAAAGDVAAMLKATTYREATSVLVQRLLPARPPTPLSPRQLTSHAKGRFGVVASLYAMACARPSGLGAPDLSDPDMVFPHAPMSLAPLWRGDLQRSFGAFILATPATAEVLDRHGGWNRSAYEELRCGDEALDTQCIPKSWPEQPGTPAAAQLVKAREQAVLSMINGYLRDVGALSVA